MLFVRATISADMYWILAVRIETRLGLLVGVFWLNCDQKRQLGGDVIDAPSEVLALVARVREVERSATATFRPTWRKKSLRDSNVFGFLSLRWQ